MKYKKIKTDIIKTAVIVLACFIISVAVDFYFKSNIGGDAMTVFLDGMNKSTGISQGWITILLNALFVILILFFDYKKIGVGTIIIVCCYGLILDFVLKYSILPYSNSLFQSIIFCLIGVVLAALSIALWIKMEFGYSPLEGFLVVLSEKTKISFTIYKISLDVLLLISGVIFGGNLNFGTLITALLTGPLITQFRRLFKKWKIME
jgi:hypothetical protein